VIDDLSSPTAFGSERIYKGGFDRTREFLFPER